MWMTTATLGSHGARRSVKSGRLTSLSFTRGFGFGTNWPETSKRKKAKKQTAPKKQRPKQDSRMSKEHAKVVPPAFLLPTASPHAYIARSAAVQNDLDPRAIFAHMSTDPWKQANGQQHFVHQESLPKDSSYIIHEVAFLGRSNVGKSSLINAMMQKKLARTSKRPGRTQQAHYFALQDILTNADIQRDQQPRTYGYLVDLPGYGYAVGPDAAVDTWQARTQQLLLSRRDAERLKRVYLLIDARHGCLDFDYTIMRWLDEACIPYSIVLTKSDAVTLPMRVKWVNQVCMRYEHLVGSAISQLSNSSTLQEDGREDEFLDCWLDPVIHLTSSNDGMGLLELKHSILDEFQVD